MPFFSTFMLAGGRSQKYQVISVTDESAIDLYELAG